MHLSEGEIRSYLDRQLEPVDVLRAEDHLAACSTCRSQMQIQAEQAVITQKKLAQLDEPPASSINASAARVLLAARLQSSQEEIPMFKKFTARIPRTAWVTMVMLAVLVIAMSFAPVRTLASNFLQLFRVEQVRILPVDFESLPGDLESSNQLEAMFTDNVAIEERGDPQEVASLEEASSLAGFDLRLPTAFETEPNLVYLPGGGATFTINLELARGVLREMGRSDIVLPDSLEDAQVQVEIPNSVAATLGKCDQPSKDENFDPDRAGEADPGQCTTFIQMPSPQVTAPPDLDLAELGNIYLQVLGMSENEAALFSRSVDWSTTFVLPVPKDYAEYQEVQVDGVTGTLITEHGYGKAYTLLWVNNGIVYMLNGNGERADALKIANSLQ